VNKLGGKRSREVLPKVDNRIACAAVGTRGFEMLARRIRPIYQRRRQCAPVDVDLIALKTTSTCFGISPTIRSSALCREGEGGPGLLIIVIERKAYPQDLASGADARAPLWQRPRLGSSAASSIGNPIDHQRGCRLVRQRKTLLPSCRGLVLQKAAQSDCRTRRQEWCLGWEKNLSYDFENPPSGQRSIVSAIR